MDWIDREYIEIASASVGGLFEPQGYDAPIIYSDDRKYIDPLEFEAYIRSLPAQLWAPEFRNALDTIKHQTTRLKDEDDPTINNPSKVSIIDALTMAAAAVRTLAKTYCPEILAELESQQPDGDRPRSFTEVTDQGAELPELPAALKYRPEARTAFDSLVEAGYLDREYKPTKFDEGKPKANIYSYIARTVCDLLNITYYCKIFGPYFGINSNTMKQSYRQAMAAQGLQPWRAEINKALARAAQDDDRLGRTRKGKELIKELLSKHK